MQLVVKKNNTLLFNEFEFKWSKGINGTTKNKYEGDKKTPKGTFSLENLYYRKDRIKFIETKLKKIPITKNMGWCDDVNSKFYNKPIKIDKNIRHEKLFRNDKKYDLIIPIKYNFKNPIKNKGSAIFIHLTNNYKKTLGCIALKQRRIL